MGVSKNKAPSYKGYSSSSVIHSQIKKANQSSNTGPEKALRKALHRLGLRYRLKTQHLPGRPDLIFPSARLAVFCDGDFWHGRDWGSLQSQLRRRANSDYWIAKIGYNMRRDLEVTRQLTNAKWRVLRIWESEILQDPEKAAIRVMRLLYSYTDPNSMEDR